MKDELIYVFPFSAKRDTIYLRDGKVTKGTATFYGYTNDDESCNNQKGGYQDGGGVTRALTLSQIIFITEK